jgi:chromate transporter
VLIAFFGPTAALALLIGRLWKHLEKWPWRNSIERGLSPVSIGLLLAGCLSLARGAVTGWMTAMITVAALAVLLLTKLNPAWLVLAGAIVGGLAYGPVKF